MLGDGSGDQRSDTDGADRRATALRVRSDRVDGDDERHGAGGRSVDDGSEARHDRRCERDGEDGERSPPPPDERERERKADAGGDRPLRRRERFASSVAGGINRPDLELHEDGQAESERPVAVNPDEPRERHAPDGSAVVTALPRPRERSPQPKDRSRERRGIATARDDAGAAPP